MRNSRKPNLQIKPYLHFDNRIPPSKKVIKKIQDNLFVASHSFYPFIHYKIEARKYRKEKGLSNPKKRDIFYAGHMDGYIFKYYGEILNNKYNETCFNKKIDHVSLAYRNNKKGRSNIQFAAEVIEFISKQKKAFIFVSDFSKYFDSLNHDLLKAKLINVLGVNSRLLPSHWWNIFKHVTQYSWIGKEDIENDLRNRLGRNFNFNNIRRYYTPAQFREFRKRTPIKKNDKDYGVPQGTAISAVLANIYAINLDEELNNYAENLGGLYRRYSDDIILVIPMKKTTENNSDVHVNFIADTVNKNKIKMGKSKTNVLYFKKQKIYKDYEYNTKGKMDYLGFSFDGYTVKIRDKSLFRYYNKMYKKINSIKKAERKTNKKIGRRKLYQLYSHLGRRYRGYGNFISYAERAHMEFSKNKKIESQIYNQIKRHWNKIYRRLNTY